MSLRAWEPRMAKVIVMREPRRPYGRDWYAARGGPAGPDHPVTLEAERRVRRRRAQIHARIRERSGHLCAGLDGELLQTWLALERDLYAYLLEVAAEHYNQGVRATLRGSESRRPDAQGDVKARIQRLLKSLADEVARLP